MCLASGLPRLACASSSGARPTGWAMLRQRPVSAAHSTGAFVAARARPPSFRRWATCLEGDRRIGSAACAISENPGRGMSRSGRSEAAERHAPSDDDESGTMQMHVQEHGRAGPSSSRATDRNRCRRTGFPACEWAFCSSCSQRSFTGHRFDRPCPIAAEMARIQSHQRGGLFVCRQFTNRSIRRVCATIVTPPYFGR